MISTEITSYLEGAGIGLTFGTNLSWGGFESTSPDDAVAIIPYLGDQPVRTKTGPEWDFVRFQVVSRSKSYVTAMNKALEVYLALGEVQGETVEGADYDFIRPLQYPFYDGGPRDDGGRLKIRCNYRAKRRAE